MNNVTFGNERIGYYETVAGGAGAGPHWHGRSGVHTHMTNTRITDPEILEKRWVQTEPEGGAVGTGSWPMGLLVSQGFKEDGDECGVCLASRLTPGAPFPRPLPSRPVPPP